MISASMKHCDREESKKKIKKEKNKENLGREAREVKNAKQLAEEAGLISKENSSLPGADSGIVIPEADLKAIEDAAKLETKGQDNGEDAVQKEEIGQEGNGEGSSEGQEEGLKQEGSELPKKEG